MIGERGGQSGLLRGDTDFTLEVNLLLEVKIKVFFFCCLHWEFCFKNCCQLSFSGFHFHGKINLGAVVCSISFIQNMRS